MQSFELTKNYRKRGTLKKSAEVHMQENIPTPVLIFCSDPPQDSDLDKLVHDFVPQQVSTGITYNDNDSEEENATIFNLPITTMNTMFKVFTYFMRRKGRVF